MSEGGLNVFVATPLAPTKQSEVSLMSEGLVDVVGVEVSLAKGSVMLAPVAISLAG